MANPIYNDGIRRTAHHAVFDMNRVPRDGRFSYVVKPGDTLAKIARNFSVTVDELAYENNIQPEDYGRLFAGEILRLPTISLNARPYPMPARGSYNAREQTYSVQPGDTLYAISRRFGVEMDMLMALNEMTSADVSAFGQLKVGGTISVGGSPYTVVPRDSMVALG